MELKKSSGLRLGELAQAVGFDEPKTHAILNALANEKKLRDQGPVKLVVCDAQGVWTAPDV